MLVSAPSGVHIKEFIASALSQNKVNLLLLDIIGFSEGEMEQDS